MGDPACWLSSTCLSCGRFVDAELVDDDNTCPHCGAELPPPVDESPSTPER